MLTFHRYPAANDVIYFVEGSPDLLSWQPLAQATGMGAWSLAQGFALAEAFDGTVTVADNVSASCYFYRLRIVVP